MEAQGNEMADTTTESATLQEITYGIKTSSALVLLPASNLYQRLAKSQTISVEDERGKHSKQGCSFPSF